jgi:hypothetical protein
MNATTSVHPKKELTYEQVYSELMNAEDCVYYYFPEASKARCQAILTYLFFTSIEFNLVTFLKQLHTHYISKMN